MAQIMALFNYLQTAGSSSYPNARTQSLQAFQTEGQIMSQIAFVCLRGPAWSASSSSGTDGESDILSCLVKLGISPDSGSLLEADWKTPLSSALLVDSDFNENAISKDDAVELRIFEHTFLSSLFKNLNLKPMAEAGKPVDLERSSSDAPPQVDIQNCLSRAFESTKDSSKRADAVSLFETALLQYKTEMKRKSRPGQGSESKKSLSSGGECRDECKPSLDGRWHNHTIACMHTQGTR